MRRIRTNLILLAALAAAGSLNAAPPIRLFDLAERTSSTNEATEVTWAAEETLLEPIGTIDEGALPPAESEPLPAGDDFKLSLEELEQMALANNPAIGQAMAHVTALRGKWDQVGRPPNPTAGYLAEEMGDEGTAGKQGGFIGQDFITGGKLRLNRAIVAQEIQRAEQWLAAATISTRTDVRKAYYKALVAKDKVEFATNWNGQATKARAALMRARAGKDSQMSRIETFPLDVLYQNAPVELAKATGELEVSLRHLSVLVGNNIGAESLENLDIGTLPARLNWNEQLLRVTTISPETAAASAQIGRAQSALLRARVERIPDLSTEVTVQFDNVTEDTVAGVRVGLPLPIWNRNQGGIRQAQSEFSESRRNLNRTQDDLALRLATAFQAYSVARATVEAYNQPPPADTATTGDTTPPENLSPLQEAEEARQHAELLFSEEISDISALEAATVYRGYTEINLLNLDALDAYWAARVEIEGLLLSDSLAQPPHDDFEQ